MHISSFPPPPLSLPGGSEKGGGEDAVSIYEKEETIRVVISSVSFRFWLAVTDPPSLQINARKVSLSLSRRRRRSCSDRARSLRVSIDVRSDADVSN